ncbi:MAG: hypothetical protein SOX86_03005 [Bacilli bacterium]|nr:hypothetical protein [Bacilli bacterium]
MNFFKKFEKLKVKYKTNKKRILSITVTAVGIACLLIGSSMAYLLFEASGTTQTISAGTLQLSYTNESEAIILNNAVPQSDEQGLNNNVYSITLTNTSTIKSYYELSLNNNCTVGNSYTVNGSSVTANVCIPNNYIKVAVKTNKDEDYTIKNGGNVILKGYLEAKENISFEMIIWLTEETPNDYQGQTETGTPRNVIYNGNFKIYTRQIIDQNETLDSSGANKPVLASNMIPVYYDETNEVWKKADANNKNSSYQWYSYESSGNTKGMWANAVTVTETNRQTYLNATPGTPISMDDITTMWVWIPRFKVNTTDFDAISGECKCSNSSYTTKEECIYDYNSWNCPNPGAIDVTFVKQNETAIDAFTFGDKELSGFWYGKFEIGGTLASTCTNETCNVSNIVVKPNVQSLRYNSVSNFFFASRSMEQTGNSFGFVSSEVNTHMSKNNEWGAVAYLTQSVYGRCTSSTTCTEVYINNSSGYYTGRSRGAAGSTPINGTYTDQTITDNYNTYGFYTYDDYLLDYGTNTKGNKVKGKGTGASTTKNIYGIYDMSGGAYEYVMGVLADSNGNPRSGYDSSKNSGFTGMLGNGTTYTGIAFPDSKYYNLYTGNSYQGHALTETKNWYSNGAAFVYGGDPWFVRGGYNYIGDPKAGVFNFINNYGNSGSYYSSRLVISNE